MSDRRLRHTRESILALAFQEPNTGCWLWSGKLKKNGYGSVNFNGHRWLAHRLVFVLERGAIPDGLQLDHLCRNRACVNPDHLEPVAQAENVRRGLALKNKDGVCRKCGGPLTDQKDASCCGGVARRCFRCKNERNRKYMRGYYAARRDEINAKRRKMAS